MAKRRTAGQGRYQPCVQLITASADLPPWAPGSCSQALLGAALLCPPGSLAQLQIASRLPAAWPSLEQGQLCLQELGTNASLCLDPYQVTDLDMYSDG